MNFQDPSLSYEKKVFIYHTAMVRQYICVSSNKINVFLFHESLLHTQMAYDD